MTSTPLGRTTTSFPGGGIQKHVDQMVRQQVDLVHIEDSPVGRRENLAERLAGLLQGLLEVERADGLIFGRPERQLHKRHWPLDLAPCRPMARE